MMTRALRSAALGARSRNDVLKILVKISISLSLLLCAGAYPVFAGSDPPEKLELADNWKLSPADGLSANGAAISVPDYDDSAWYKVRRMPATVLEVLRENNLYPNLYVGKNLVNEVPQDLYKQDWWYRTTFSAPEGRTTYQLEFPGINYRGEIWLNGHLVADSDQVVGMYNAHELDVTPWIVPGASNTLAVKVTPERALQDIDGVELADSWYDWINWNYLGYQGPGKNPANGNSFVPDRNAGILKPVYLKATGAVELGAALVTSELPLPRTDSARLTIRANVHNYSAQPVRGVLRATITRPGKPSIQVAQPIRLSGGQNRPVSFTPDKFAQLTVGNPDLWWPYTMGAPNLYNLRLDFLVNSRLSDSTDVRFGIRQVSQHRDEEDAPNGGDFYLTVNGKDFLVRGATYTPDLLFKYDPDRETAILRYAKDLGLNMLRLEGKLTSEHLVETADELGIPLMFGWMCCNQWEKWDQWNEEDQRVAQDSLRSQILMLRDHASVFVWANGSDGLPPPPIRAKYNAILRALHWQNATVDTVSTLAKDKDGAPEWDGIDMAGPYSWRPPTYWFSGRYGATSGATAEQGDNEHVPPFASLRKFIPPDKLWPINDTWYFHAGSDPNNARLTSIRRAVDLRYGPSNSAEMFAEKAQLAHYESTRAQFEAFAANGWASHKMTVYWMLNNHWPSFFGNLFDYYLRPGGAYYGAKKGLRPLSVVFDSYATGDHRQAKITVVNQTQSDQKDLRVRVRVYDLDGALRDDGTADGVSVSSGAAVQAMTLPPEAEDSGVFFVRAELLDTTGKVVAENVYWQSQRPDDVGDPENDQAFDLQQVSWADMTPVNYMPPVPLDVTAQQTFDDDNSGVVIRLHNPTAHIAFFERAEITSTPDGDEILPIQYDDNYVTVFPGETVQVRGVLPTAGQSANWVRVSGYNTAPVVVPIS
ncbi:MAG TPA: glycoside hydrolase [Mycobacterium sp.]|nr:glycoside hydrolase [Mycobacterium sp.]